MDLFQTYLTKTSDLQTAVLATAFTNPLYVDDLRWEMWRETYFDQMQSWRAFNERTKFTVQHSHLARAKDGKTLAALPPKQVTLRCNHCQGSLTARNTTAGRSKNGVPITGPAAHAGTVCPQCGRHMPRCAICQLWLGTPLNSANAKASKACVTKVDETLAEFLAFCAKGCGHGFHAHHAKEWFGKHGICPVPDCRCMCGLS